MQLPRPPQISTDPAVNASAMQWANQFLTALEQSGSLQGRYRGRMDATAFALLADVQDNDAIDLVVDATNGIVWSFVYRAASSSTYKWEFIGGPPFAAAVDTAETTASTTYAALTTAGPSVALPRAGDYLIELGAYMRTTTAGASALMSYDIGGTGAIDGNGIQVDSAAASNGSHSWRRRRLTGFTAVTLTSKYRVSAGTGTFGSRYLSVLPLRIS